MLAGHFCKEFPVFMFALLQDSPPPAEAPAEKPQLGVDVNKVTQEFMTDPTSAMGRWMDVGWDMLKIHGPGVIGAFIIMFIAYALAKWARGFVIRGCNRAKIDITLGKFFGNMAKWAILIFGVVTAAGTVGISTTGFAALIGAAGLAIGLALQGNLGNLAAGVLLLVFRPFKIGDSVIVAGQTGIIDGIDLFTTNVDTADNRRVIVPNGAIFGGVIENQTHHPRRRIDVTATIAGSHDIEKSREILRGVISRVIEAGIGAIADAPNAVTLNEVFPNQVWSINLWAQTAKFGAVRERLLIELRTTIDREQVSPGAAVQLVRHVP
jgi:small conductance mechanosensitive channel